MVYSREKKVDKDATVPINVKTSKWYQLQHRLHEESHTTDLLSVRID